MPHILLLMQGWTNSIHKAIVSARRGAQEHISHLDVNMLGTTDTR